MADSVTIRLVSWFQLSSPPAPQVRTESQSLTSTLMAQRPMARTAFRTKSTSTSVAYSLSSAKTCGPEKMGLEGSGGVTSWNTRAVGMHRLLEKQDSASC